MRSQHVELYYISRHGCHPSVRILFYLFLFDPSISLGAGDDERRGSYNQPVQYIRTIWFMSCFVRIFRSKDSVWWCEVLR